MKDAKTRTAGSKEHSDIDIIDVKAGVEALNDEVAEEVRGLLRAHKVFMINLMGSPGAGKTSVILRTIAALSDRYRIAVMEADVDSDVDAAAVAAAGAQSLQLHTGGSCHMDAKMTLRGLEAIGLGDGQPRDRAPQDHGAQGRVPEDNRPRIVILENVGNLVCPAEFDVGADLKVMILSVPEGDDKPLKYPLMFKVSDLLLINKTDTAQIFDFDLNKCAENVSLCHPGMEIIPLSAKTGEGFETWIEWLDRRIREWAEGIRGDGQS